MSSRAEVQRGIELLDERLPGWRKFVELERLDMDSSEDCVLGQLFGSYTRGLGLLGLKQQGIEYGFSARRHQSYWVEAVQPFEFTAKLSRRQAYLLASLLNSNVTSSLSAEIGLLPDMLHALGVEYPQGVRSNGIHPDINSHDPDLPV